MLTNVALVNIFITAISLINLFD